MADSTLFREQCKKHNLKITPQRILIYESVFGSEEHPNTERVYNSVKKKFPNISFDTVHRTLQTFSEIGLLSVVEGFGCPKRFDPNLNNHHHLQCEICGSIFDFTYDKYDNLQVPKKIISGFIINRKRVVISGICNKCRDG